VDAAGSESCPVMGFGIINDIEPSQSVYLKVKYKLSLPSLMCY
jgi:hypothetical protein